MSFLGDHITVNMIWIYQLVDYNILKTTFFFDLLQPPKIRCFINCVTSVPLEKIEEPLKSFVWEFDKVPLWPFLLMLLIYIYLFGCVDSLLFLFYAQGDFHHWVDLFNHFDSFFEKYVKPRKDLQIDDDFLDSDPPFPREAVLQILRVIRIILDNCTNKHFYSSYEVWRLSYKSFSTLVNLIRWKLR